jgi:hypothetical protein
MEVSRQYLGQHQLIQIISNVDPEWLVNFFNRVLYDRIWLKNE